MVLGILYVVESCDIKYYLRQRMLPQLHHQFDKDNLIRVGNWREAVQSLL